MFEILDRYAQLVDELHAADLEVLSQDELLEVTRQVEVQRRRMAGVDHALIAQLEARGTAHEVAARSTSMLVQQLLRQSPAEAGRRVHAAKRMGPRRALTGEALPPLRAEIAKGQAAGVVSAEQARVITQELNRLPAATPVDVVEEAEESLVGLAGEHAPVDLRKLAQHLVSCLDPDGQRPTEADLARQRYAHLGQDPDGMFELRARLTPECGAAWQAIFSTLATPTKGEDRTSNQRTHDARLEAAARLVNLGDLPDCNGVPVTVLLTMNIDQLESRTGTVTTAHGGNLTVEHVITMGTKAGIVPVVFTDTGVLAYGRRRRLASLGQRYALYARDLRCSHAGWHTQIESRHCGTTGAETALHTDRNTDAAQREPCEHRCMDLGRITATLAREGYPCDHAELRRDGTCPVLRTDTFVVKLFTGERLDYETELAAYQLLTDTDIPTPRLLAHGQLDGCDYLIVTRMHGQAVLDSTLTMTDRLSLAQQLGSTLNRLHQQPLPHAGRFARDWMREHRPTAAQRHRAWQTLPSHLVEQIDDYLVPPQHRALVHADLAVEHVFTTNGNLTGIIDWGGAEATDPHYELPVLHLDLFGADKRQLAAFLDAYGWHTDDFVRRAMSAIICGEFDTFELATTVRPDIDLTQFDTLEELADTLWRI